MHPRALSQCWPSCPHSAAILMRSVSSLGCDGPPVSSGLCPPLDRLFCSFCSQHLTYLFLIGSRFKVRGRSNAQKNHILTQGYHGVWSVLEHRCYKTDQWRGPSGLKTWMKPLDTHIDLHTLTFTSLSVWGTCWAVRLKGDVWSVAAL